MRRGSGRWAGVGGGGRGHRYGDFGQWWRRGPMTGSSAGATPLLSLGSKPCANARPGLWPAVGARPVHTAALESRLDHELVGLSVLPLPIGYPAAWKAA